MSPDRTHAEALLQAVVLGERRADDADWLAALAAFPDLRQRAADLQATQAALDWSDEDAAAIAAAAAGQATAADRAALAAAPLPRRVRPFRGLWLLAAALALAVGVAFWPRPAAPDGPLGPTPRVTVEPSGGRYRVLHLAELSGGARYVLRLTIDGKPLPVQSFDGPAIEFPEPWQTAVDGATTATLQVFAGDVSVAVLPIK